MISSCALVTRRQLLVLLFSGLAVAGGLAATVAGAAVRVAVIGDYGEDTPTELAVATLVHGMSPDIVVTLGDNSYDSNPIDANVGKYYARYIGGYTGNYPPGAAVNRFFPSLGNHDYSDGGGLAAYLQYFTLPGVQSSNTSGNERYYDFVYGPIHFFALNSNAKEPDGIDSTSVQARWLQVQLAASTAPWKIVFMHHAPYSSGASHGSIKVMQWPYRVWGANAVLAAHDHVYERLVFDGFPYFVNGLGGRDLKEFGTPQPGSVVRYRDDYGAMRLTADNARLTFEFFSVAPGNPVIDTFTLLRQGALPDLAVSPPGLDFGSTVVGAATVRSVVLHNMGSGALAVDSITVAGADAMEFAARRAQGSMPKRLPVVSTASVTPFALSPGDSTLVVVRFAPTTAGSKSALLRFQSDDPDHPTLDVPLTGEALAPLAPHIGVSPAAIEFGPAVILTSLTQGLKVRNPGTGTLQVASVTLMGPDAAAFAIQNGGGGFALAPGDSSQIVLRFLPTSVGNKSAALRLTSNDPDQPVLDVRLTGVGVPPLEPDIALSATACDFGGVLAAAGQAAHSLVVRNAGNALLSVSQTNLVGGLAADFALTAGSAPFSLAPGDSAVLGLRFAPTTSGTKSATLRIQCNDPQQGTVDVVLTGIGIASSATRLAVVFQESVDGTATGANTVSTSRSVAAVNGALYVVAVSSKDEVTVSSITGLGLAWTRLRAQCSGRQQTMVEIWAASGTPSAGVVTARFASAPTSAAIVVTRYGGAAPVPFGSIASANTNGVQGRCSGGTDTAVYALPLTTTMPGAVVFVAAAIRNRDFAPGSGYVLRDVVRAGSGGWITGLAALERTVATPSTVSVNGTFSQDVDWAVAALEIVPAIVFPEITVTPVDHDFGALLVGTSAVTGFEIRNDGAADLRVPGASVQGVNAAEFAIASGGTVPVLAPGARHTVSVRFAPTAALARSASLRLVSDDPDEITRDLPLTGLGIAAIADIVVTPAALGFGSIPALTRAARLLQVSNQGNVALHVTQVRVIGTDSLSFIWSGATVPISLLPGDSTNLELAFAPPTPGAKSATLRLSSNDPDAATLDVPLTGTALAAAVADIVVRADTLDFGMVAVSANATRTLRIRNAGTGSLTVNAPEILGPAASEFALANAAGFTLAPGDSTSLVLRFTPTSPGAKSARLQLTSNDPDESPAEVALTGGGVLLPEGRVVFAGSVDGGSTSKTTVTTATSLAAQPGDLVLAAIASKGYVNVTAVSGLGLTWTPVRAQCGGRSQTGIHVWKGSGTPSPGPVTATLASAPTSAVIVVACYSGADPVTPIGTISAANTLGAGGACSGGSDTAAFTMNQQTTVNDATIFAAVAMRSRILTPGNGYTLRDRSYTGPDGSVAGMAVIDRGCDAPSTVTVNGSFDGAVDWAVVGIEIRPYVGAVKQTATAPEPVLAAGLVLGHGIGGDNRWVEIATPQPAATRVRLVDVRGRTLQTLFDGVLPAGRTRFPWRTSEAARALPTGVYFVHAEIGAQRFVRKTLLLR